MTKFDKELFTWDGSYLMYTGTYEGAKTYGEVYGTDKCHESRINVQVSAFIARFKYNSKPWKTWRNFIVKNFTVEEYLELSKKTSPLQTLEYKGYKAR
tara:strand:+ start:140 stop:433 length:294 start_codon:yes stop_codon:yes gene_type:complete